MISATAFPCLVRLTAVSKTYGVPGRESKVLNAVSLRVNAGELLMLMGPSGSGKTTLLTIIAGLQAATSGEIELFGKWLEEYSHVDLQSLRASRIGFVFQGFHLIDSLTVIENVELVMRFGGQDHHMIRRRAEHLIGSIGMGYATRARPPTLSQGEKQRVAIARALANGADLILADEPTANLSSTQGLEVVRLLRKQTKSSGRSVVVVSHDERIMNYADRVLYLEDGRLVSHPTHQTIQAIA